MRSIAEGRLRRAAPLVQFADARAGPGLRFVFDGQDAVAERQAPGHREVHQGARALARDDVVMAGLAADDAAERHRRIVGRAGRRGRIEGDGDRRRDFEGARHGQDVDARLGRPQRLARAAQELVGDVVVEARLDDEDADAGDRRRPRLS